MTRLRRIEDRDRIFFVTFNVEAEVAPLDETERDLVLHTLGELRVPCDFGLYGYVVMPDHVHILLWPRTVSLIRVLRDLKSRSGFAIASRRGARGPFWQRSYFDFICRRARDFSNKLEYIHRNPVAAKLVTKPQDWKWSSYRFHSGRHAVLVTPDLLEFSGDPDELLWPAPWRRS